MAETARPLTPSGAGAPVVVIGAGLAGLTAALDLAEHGIPTTLVERRPFPGGKTFSFRDADVELDNGQHITLRCCTAYAGLLERLGLGSAMRMQRRLSVLVLDPVNGQRGAIAADRGLPAPLHLARAMATYPHLTHREKARLLPAALTLWRMPGAKRRALDGVTFAEWLRAHGQSARAIDRFWDLIILPTCNDRAAEVSARQAIMILQVGFLRDAHAAEIGVASVGLSRIAEAALARFRDAGGQARFGQAVRALDRDGERVTGVLLARGERLPAGAVVLALAPHQAAALIPPVWRGRAGLRDLDRFEQAPIVNVYMHWDRPVMEDEFVAVLDPAVQYVFNRTRLHGLDGPGQWLGCSLSGAHEAVERPQASIAEAAIDGVRRAFPAARGAQVLRWRVVKEVEATFRPLPGVAALRPNADAAGGNLFLAGAWTNTEWPATMESAVRSGHAAAHACLHTSEHTSASE